MTQDERIFIGSHGGRPDGGESYGGGGGEIGDSVDQGAGGTGAGSGIGIGNGSEDGHQGGKVGTVKAEMSNLRLAQMFAFAFGNGVLLSSYFIVTLPIESKRISAKDSALILGGFVAIAGLTQLICPIVGLLSDRCLHHHWGKRKPFIIYGGICGVFGLFLQWYGRENELWLVYVFAFTISMVALNTIYSSMNGLIADFVPESQVGTANGIIGMLSVAGAVSSFGAFHVIHSWGASSGADANDVTETVGGNDSDTLALFYWFYIFVIAVTVTLTAMGATDSTKYSGQGGKYQLVGRQDNPSSTAHAIKPITMQDLKESFFISPSEHRDFFLVLLSRTLYYMGVSSQAFLMYYVRDVLLMSESDSEQFTAILAVIGQFCGVLTAFPVGYISDKMKNGRKMYIYLSCTVLAIGNLALISARTQRSVMIISGVLGAANGAYMVCDGSLAIDALPCKDQAARFMGLWGCAAFIGTTLGMVNGPVLWFFGNSILGYAVLLTLSAVFLACSAFVLKTTVVN